VLGISASANTRVLFDTADQLGVFYLRDDQLGLLDLPARIAQLQAKLAEVDAV